ncbi:MAG: hypothetical protein WBC78_16910 [Candidatus Sulfotelmatobacter sp.]
MLQPHSVLWHYLWLGPQVLQAALAIFLWRRGLHKLFPFFLAYLVFGAIEQFTLYAMDILPWVSTEAFWKAFWAGAIIEGAIKFAVIGELFFHLLRSRPALAKVGSRLISGAGAAFVLLAVAAAACTPVVHRQIISISHAHLLLQSSYVVDCGLALFLFLFAAHFDLVWNHRAFGIALGLGIVWCEHMAAWALSASGAWLDKSYLLDFVNGATYHVCVLIWFYYLLVPQKVATTSAVPLPENNLDIWNRELERLLQQ